MFYIVQLFHFLLIGSLIFSLAFSSTFSSILIDALQIQKTFLIEKSKCLPVAINCGDCSNQLLANQLINLI